MNELLTSQAMGIMMTMVFYLIGGYLYQKTKWPFVSPLLVATLLLIGYIQLFQIDLHMFLTDLSGIHVFLGPLIVSLAVPIAKNFELIKKNSIIILVGSFVGALSSILSIIFFGPILGLDSTLIASVIPKSATTPIAIEISERLGGIRPITVAVVVMTAVLGAIVVPWLIKILKIKDPRIIGMTLGATSHAIGTSKALEMDLNAGSISGIALVISGVATTLITLFII